MVPAPVASLAPAAMLAVTITPTGRGPRARLALATPRAIATTVTVVTAWPRGTDHLLRPKNLHRDYVGQHVLLQRDRGIARKNQPIVVLEQVARLVNEQLLGTRKVSEVIGPDHDLEAAEIFPAGQSRPKTLHPRCRPKDGSGHSLAENVRRHAGQLEMHPKTSIKPHRLTTAGSVARI
jgi:hypothetical protein